MNFSKNNKGFSLVELIVVIAIMAVMTAILAPSLLQYVEKSRAQKDDSAMGEVTQVVKLAMADQDVYDELLCYTVKGNVANYAAGEDEEALAPDEANTMRGVTITFSSTKNANATTFDLGAAAVNAFVAEGTTSYNGNDATGATLATMTSGATEGELYNKILAAIGEEVALTSQTYRNSDYTIFINIDITINVINVTGQWGGTNLPGDGSAGGAGSGSGGNGGGSGGESKPNGGTLTIIRGDVDGDGEITAADANMVIDFYVNSVELSPIQKITADVNGNGKVNNSDAYLIQDFIAGSISEFPAADVVIIYGDVDGDGDIDADDADMIQEYKAGRVELATTQRIAADVNGDGLINISDSVNIQQYVAGQISKFPVAESGS